MNAVTIKQVSELCGVSRMAVYRAIEASRCPAILVNKKQRVDLHDPDAQAYIAGMQAKYGANPSPSAAKERAKPAREPKPAKGPIVPVVPPDTSDPWPPDVEGLKSPPPDENSAPGVKMRKAIANAALEEVKLQTAAEAYFEKVGAVVDIETLRRKIATLEDVLVSHLIYMPEEVADVLWLEAKASEDPPKTIRETLSARIATIIKEIKRETKKVAPPKSRVYAVVDNGES